MTKICLITCYDQPDYIRARTLRAAFSDMPEVELIVIKNKHINFLRYPEVLWKVMVARFRHHPDIYFQTFRAYESFPFIRLVAAGRPFIFDEFINPIEQVAYENHRIKPGGIIESIARLGYKFWLSTVNLIVTDTPSHARYSAKLMKLPIDKYVPLIVSTDELVFVTPSIKKKLKKTSFTVFYYGLYMTPLQGLDTMIDAMRLLQDQNIRLVLIGGRAKSKQQIKSAQADGVRIDYKPFVDFNDLPLYMDQADVCLAGPFGGTVQAQYVIGGKTYQYLNMGRPVIIGQNEESHLWTDKKDALIVPQANPKALAGAIIWAKDHPRQLAEIGEKGKKLYNKKLSNEVLKTELYSMLADKRLL